ncbi:hypothetical protein ACEQ8H_003710 [Pleosporales sp. CAS-2024a]
MTGVSSPRHLTPFEPAVTEEDVKACSQSYDTAAIINNLLELAHYLITLDQHTKTFNDTKHDPYIPSLKTLYDRLTLGVTTLTPLPSLAKDAARLRKTLNVRLSTRAVDRALEDFEDVYYALLARLQDMGQMLAVRITNGFNDASDAVFDQGPSFSDLYHSLASYWAMLNDAGCARALDHAIRNHRIAALLREINAELETGAITPQDADELLRDLYENRHVTDGLAWISGWSPAMIGAYLAEKYHLVLQLHKQEDERRRIVASMASKKPVGGSMAKRRSTEKMRRGPAQKAHFVHQRQEKVGVQVQHHHVVLEQERVRQQKIERDVEWRRKAQRVSEYSNYLRGAASHSARFMVGASAHNYAEESGLGPGGAVARVAENHGEDMEM